MAFNGVFMAVSWLCHAVVFVIVYHCCCFLDQCTLLTCATDLVFICVIDPRLVFQNKAPVLVLVDEKKYPKQIEFNPQKVKKRGSKRWHIYITQHRGSTLPGFTPHTHSPKNIYPYAIILPLLEHWSWWFIKSQWWHLHHISYHLLTLIKIHVLRPVAPFTNMV